MSLVTSRIAVIAAPYAPDKLPLTGVADLPGYISGSCEGTDRLWPLVREGGVIDEAEYEAPGLHVLFVTVPPPYKIMTPSREVTSMQSLTGLKMRGVGGAHVDTVCALEGTPVQVQVSELYGTLSHCTVDGAVYVFATAILPIRVRSSPPSPRPTANNGARPMVAVAGGWAKTLDDSGRPGSESSRPMRRLENSLV